MTFNGLNISCFSQRHAYYNNYVYYLYKVGVNTCLNSSAVKLSENLHQNLGDASYLHAESPHLPRILARHRLTFSDDS